MKTLQQSFGEVPIAVSSLYTNEPENAADIVFVHMSWGGAWAFELYADFFAENGYNCHSLDLRGHGKSGGRVEGATMQDYVSDVRSVVVGLNLSNPIIIGHSMGGLIALKYSSEFSSAATASLDGSPPIEVQKESVEKSYPASYTPKDSGMPGNPMKAMKVLPDMPLMRMMKMKFSLKTESGIARSDRKRGVSVPKESLTQPLLFIGAELGTSLPFGIGIEKAKAQADYYGVPIVEIKGATHPGLLLGKFWKESAQAILKWLQQNNL